MFWRILVLLATFQLISSVQLEQLPTDVQASSLPSKRGFTTIGAINTPAGQRSGSSIATVGDVNKDGFSDYLIGATYGTYLARQYCGISYVVYGGVNTANVDLTSLPKSKGFRILGAIGNDFSGNAVAGLDINKDGYSDLVVGAANTNPTVGGVFRSYAGTTYVIYGKANRTTDVDLLNLASTDGFKIFGGNQSDYSGRSVARAGDVNGDGFEDLLVGAPSATRLGKSKAGAAYVIFGKSSGFTDIDLGTLASSAAGIRILGARPNAYTGYALSAAGDFNDDGIKDFMVGAYGDGSNGQGVVYIIFGKSSGLTSMDLSSFTSSQGIRVFGETAGDQLGFSLSTAGDFNGDLISDVVIGANFVDPRADIGNAGAAYVVFGAKNIATDVQVNTFPSNRGFDFFGSGTNFNLGVAVSGGGDFDQDGYSDIVVGAEQQPINGSLNVGVAYVIAGRAKNPGTIFSNRFNRTHGFRVFGIAAQDKLGSAVDMRSDINGDGYADLLVSSPFASPLSRDTAGSTYVFFGENTGPTASPTLAPTLDPTATPTEVPTTTKPSAAPTYSPTAAPSLDTRAQLAFGLHLNLTQIMGDTITSSGRTAIQLAIQAVTGLPLNNIIYEQIVSSTQKGSVYDVLIDYQVRINLNTNPQYINNLTTLCTLYQDPLLAAIASGNFTKMVKQYAIQFSASELANVKIPVTSNLIAGGSGTCTYLDNIPTALPTVAPTLSPTSLPPTASPTFAPSLNTRVQVAFDVTLNLTKVAASSLSAADITALQLTIQAVTGLPLSNIIYESTISATPMGGSNTNLYNIIAKMMVRVNLNVNPTFENDLTTLCTNYQQLIVNAIQSGQFTTLLRQYAQQLVTADLASVEVEPNNVVTGSSGCEVLQNNPTLSPTRMPTVTNSMMPTLAPSTATVAPTLDTRVQVAFDLTLNLTKVSRNTLTTTDITALRLTIQAVTGLPFDNILYEELLSATLTGTSLYDLMTKLMIKVNLNVNPTYENDLTTLCTNYQQLIVTAVQSGQFTTLLRQYAQQLQAPAFATVVVVSHANMVTGSSGCEVLANNPTSTPTRSPTTAPPTHSPTAAPTTAAPSFAPTFAPTLDTNAQLTFDLFFNFSGVATPALSASGVTAVELALQEVTGLPLENVILVNTLSSNIDNNRRFASRSFRGLSTTYTLAIQVLMKINLRNHPEYENNRDGLCSLYEDDVTFAIENGEFTASVQKTARQVQATELYNAQTTSDTSSRVTECTYVENSGTTASSGSSDRNRVSDSVIAAIVIVVIFFVIVFFCLCYVGLAYYRKNKEEKVQYEDPNHRQSAYSGINMTSDELEIGDNTVMMFLSSDDQEEDADAFGFVHRKRASVIPDPNVQIGDDEYEEGDDDEGSEEDDEENRHNISDIPHHHDEGYHPTQLTAIREEDEIEVNLDDVYGEIEAH